ncbi:NACHT domain-containing protein [Cladophialophora immunda]|nr:NACHT domain-containing protein [Cladophialophora immunda]
MSSRIFRRKTNEPATSLYLPDGEWPSESPLNRSLINDDDVVDEKGPLGLNLLYAPSEPLIDLIFVHGLGGGSRKTWSRRPSISDYWPKEWLPKDAAFESVRIHSFGYNSDYVKSENDCWTTHRFGQSLLADLRTSPCLGKTDTHLIMVGHSMGGLVIKRAYMLAKHDTSLEHLTARFRAMYFLATPHQGSDWAKVLDRMLKIFSLSTDFVEELKKGSGALQSINEEFRHYSDQFELFSFYEMQPMKGLSSKVVEPESGVLNFPGETQTPMTADHRSICKFEAPANENDVRLRNSLATTVANILDKWAKQREAQRKRELSDLNRYLRIPQQPEDDLELVQSPRLSGTCEWIVQKESYLAWRDLAANTPTILWINGKPATGKSVLAGYIIAQLQERKLACSYYFFKHGESSKSRLINSLRSLAFQMARQDDQILRILGDLHKEDAESDGGTDRSFWRKIFLSTIFKTLKERHYWVIDGLDECEGSEAFIESLISQLDPATNLRILVTTKMMDFELQELSNTYGEAELRKVLDDVPRDMNSLYQRILDSVELTTAESGRRVAKAILKWVSCAMRPLSTEELTGALNLDLGDKYDSLEEIIPKIWGQLVAIDKFGKVQIVHETVREFLTRHDLQSDFAVSKFQVHARIAEICLSYLISDEMRPSTARRQGSRRRSAMTIENSKMKFSKYACTAFAHHLANTDCESSIFSFFFPDF